MGAMVGLAGTPSRWYLRTGVVAGLVGLAVGVAGMPAGALGPADVPRTEPAETPAPAERTDAGYLFAVDAVSARAVARLTDEVVEVIGERTGSSSVYALPNGVMISQAGTGPVRAPVGGDGTSPEDWAPLDTTLQITDEGIVPTVGATPIVLSGEAEGSPEAPVVLASATDPQTGVVVEVTWPGTLPAPVLAENRATYPEVAPGLDLVVDVTSKSFEQYYVARDAEAVAVASALPLAVRAQGASVAETEGGGVEVVTPDGAVVATSGTPLAWDAELDGYFENPVLAEPREVTVPQLPPLPGVEDLMASESPSHETSGEGTPPPSSRTAPPVGPEPTPEEADPRSVAVELTEAVEIVGETATVGLMGIEELTEAPETAYPIVIDPEVVMMAGFDTYIQSGTTYDLSGASELRLGTYDGGRTVARSYANFPTGAIAGRDVLWAEVVLWNFHSWSCNARPWEVHHTGEVGPWARWTNQPVGLGLQATSWETTGYGNCGAGWVGADITGAARYSAGNRHTQLTLGFKAQNESDNYAWKKFHAADAVYYVPAIVAAYNAPPNMPSTTKMSPSHWTAETNGWWTGSTTPTLSAVVSDPDTSFAHGLFEVADPDAGYALVWSGDANYVPSGATASIQVPAGKLRNGKVYVWRVRSSDDRVLGPYTDWFWFGVDTTAPASPRVTSTNFPADGTWHGDAGQWGNLTASMVLADPSVIRYEVDLGKAPTGEWGVGVRNGAPGTLAVRPLTVGRHEAQVRAVDRAGNKSPVTKYSFMVGRAGLLSPEPDAKVVRRARIEIGWNTGPLETQFTHAKYQWRKGPDDATIRAIDPGALRTSQGDALTWSGAWAKAPALGGYVNWDAAMTQGFTGGPIQVRAIVAKDDKGTGAAETQWVTIMVDPDATYAATTDIGPGSVNLLTGDYRMSATDVSEFGMELVRTTSSRDTDSGYELQAELVPDSQRKATNAAGLTSPSGTVTVDKTRFREGDSSFKVVPVGSGPDTYAAGFGGDVGGMRLGLKAGGTYRVSGWVYVPAASGLTPAHGCGYSLALFTRAGSGAYSNPCTNSGQSTPKPSRADTWQHVTMDVTVPANATEAFVRVYNGQPGGSGKAVYWDDISVRQIWAPFGKQWASGTTDWAAGTAYTRVKTPEAGIAEVELTGGGSVWFAEGGGQWWPAPGAEDLKLTKVNATTWHLTEIDGTVTVFRQQATGGDWPVLTSAPPAAAGESRHVYAPVNGVQRLTRVIAPIEPGIDGWVDGTTGNLQACTTATPARGCEVMDLDYAQTTTAAPGRAGVIAGQVAQAAVWTWNGSAMVKVPVAAYRYDESGRLVEVWDPRIDPVQRTVYSYDAAGRVTTVTPSGELPYAFAYGKAGSTVTGSGDLVDNGAGRTLGVSRDSLVPGTKAERGPVNTTTIVYDVPLTRDAGGPYDLQGTALASWAQVDGPTDATAVFGPEDPPGVNTATDSAPGRDGYRPAVVHYLNSAGREVNTASPAGRDAPVEGFVDTSEYDRFGNTVRTLDATNRLLALGKLPGGEAMVAELGLTGMSSADLAVLLDSRSTYSVDGLDQVTTTGPVQRLAVGNDPNDVRLLRSRTVNVYDEGNPQGAAQHLVTTTSSGGIDPLTANGLNPQADPLIDPIVTVNDYNPIDGKSPLDPSSGWVHKQPTRVTSDAGQPSASTVSTVSTLFDGRGRTLQVTKPGSVPGSAGTTSMEYYVPGGSGDCSGRPEWAGLACKTTSPAATGFDGSRMGASMPVVWVREYGPYRNEMVTVTSGVGPAGAVSRTTGVSYDAAKRVVRSHTVEEGAGAGVPVAPVVTSYDPVTGRMVRQASVDGSGREVAAVSTGYDVLGRTVSYTDASGVVTSTSYDRYDKTIKAEYTNGSSVAFEYDRSVEPRGLVTRVTDSVAGSMVPVWGPDEQLESQELPGGVRLTIGYDAARVAVSRSYARASDGVVLASDSVVENHKGQWIAHSSTVAERSYAYDRLGRLTQAREAVNDGASTCRVRDYAFDSHGNRTGLGVMVGVGADPQACESPAVVASTVFDSADRIVSTSGAGGNAWTYDGLGRMTTIPASAASMYAAQNVAGVEVGGQGAAATVQFAYFVNDLTQAQTQEGSSRTELGLDAIGRFASSSVSEWNSAVGGWGPAVVTSNHYDGSGDRPAWTRTTDVEGGSRITRYVDGPTGDLTMTTSGEGGRVLMLTDLHGDVQASLPISDGASEADWAHLAFSASDEYGNPTPLTTALALDKPPAVSNWHAAGQRQNTRLGTILMGARTYLPALGTFTTPDPVPGGNTTTYTYPQDPINQQDLNGERKIKRKTARTSVRGKFTPRLRAGKSNGRVCGLLGGPGSPRTCTDSNTAFARKVGSKFNPTVGGSACFFACVDVSAGYSFQQRKWFFSAGGGVGLDFGYTGFLGVSPRPSRGWGNSLSCGIAVGGAGVGVGGGTSSSGKPSIGWAPGARGGCHPSHTYTWTW